MTTSPSPSPCSCVTMFPALDGGRPKLFSLPPHTLIMFKIVTGSGASAASGPMHADSSTHLLSASARC
jgi:hypothetical protein